MQKLVVLDLETKKLFHEVKNGKHELLEVSVCGIYDGATDSLKAFLEAELSEIWPILENADLIVGYNIKKFDYRVLSPYYKGDLYKLATLDLYEVVKENLGFALPLDALAHATLGVRKSGSGLKAVKLFKEGRIGELKDYCLDDVKITRDLFFYAKDKGHLKFFDFANTLKEIPVDLSKVLPKKSRKTQMSLGV